MEVSRKETIMKEINKSFFSEKFISKFKINTVSLKDSKIIYCDGLKHCNDLKKTKKHSDIIFSFLKSKVTKFELIINNRKLIIGEDNKQYCFLLNVLLLEDVVNFYRDNQWNLIDEFSILYGNKMAELYNLWTSFEIDEKIEINEILKENIILLEMNINFFGVIDRIQLNNELVKKMLSLVSGRKLLNKPKCINGDISVAIYGAGKIGSLLVKLLNKWDVGISFYIDENNINDTFEQTPIIRTRDLINYQNYNLIIVTPIYDYKKIRKTLLSYTKKCILSLEEVLNSIKFLEEIS